MCVDDEPMILDVMREQLAQNFGDDFIYLTSLEAEDALIMLDESIAEGSQVVLVISDWLMPGIKGDEFLIRVHEKYPDISTVLVTGQADEDAVDRVTRLAGLKACVSKPWSSGELIKLIQKCLDESK